MTTAAPRALLIATTNAGKVRELAHILADLPVTLVGLADWPEPLPEAVEDADTFEGNAILKAQHYARLTSLWALADDSGLEVDALGGAPGVHSARYAGEPKSDDANNRKLIAALADVPADRRTARFRCAAVLCDGERVLASAHGAVDGRIVDEPAGDNGFGYDPHFFVPEHNMTAAQMPADLKNRISHRGQAVRALAADLRTLLSAGT